MIRCTLFGHKVTHVNSKALFGEHVIYIDDVEDRLLVSTVELV